MESIDHVNRYFWLRILFFPFVLLSYFIKSYSLSKAAKNYVNGSSDTPEEARYEKLLSCHHRNLLLKDHTFHFFFRRKITHQQQVFVVNRDLNWDSLVLLRYLIRYARHNYPKLLLNNIFIGKKSNLNRKTNFWDLIDSFYGENDLERAIQAKRSFIVEKSFIDRHSHVLEKIKSSHIPVTPIYFLEEKDGRFWYVSGESIKTSTMSGFKVSALENHLSKSFESLDVETKRVIQAYRKRQKDSWKEIFTSYKV